jgi:hypothetical protein
MIKKNGVKPLKTAKVFKISKSEITRPKVEG